MKSIREEIVEAMLQLKIEPNDLGSVEFQNFQGQFLSTFTSSGEYIFPIWENLVVDKCSIQSHMAWKFIGEMEFSNVEGPFILVFEQSTELGCFLFDSPTAISATLGECNPFMYYITNRSFEFLLCENDHDFLIAAGNAKAWMYEYVRLKLIDHLGNEIVNYHLPGIFD
jgi:hypothetical protein